MRDERDELSGRTDTALAKNCPLKALTEKIKAGALSDGMTVREIKERDWSGLTQRGAVHEAIEVLEGLGWVRLHTVEPGGGGRPSEVLYLNPEFTGGGKP